MKIYVKISFISLFIFFWFSNMILSASLILPVSQLQPQQMMTSQPRICNTDLLHSFAHFVVKIYENVAIMTVFNTI